MGLPGPPPPLRLARTAACVNSQRTASPSRSPLGRHGLGLALAVFLAIWGAKLVVLDRFGSDLPFWDQWSKEGDVFYPAWFERGELWRPLFAPHNEHRIAPTLALNLGLVAATGQWDARVQCVVSAGLHAAVLAGLFLWAWHRLPRPWGLATGALCALLGAAPIVWENLLSGFQSGFYFLAGFSLLAIGGLLHRAFSRRWWAGAIAAAATLVSMGSGLLCVVPVALLAAFRWSESRQAGRRDAWATLLASGLVLAWGAWLHTPIAAHATLRAHSLGEFILYASRCLAWPLPEHPWLALLFWAPWLALAIWRLKKGAVRDDAAIDFVLAAGLWVIIPVAAVAYSRGGGGGMPASRYGDLFGLGLVLAFCSLALLAPGWRHPKTIAAIWSLGAVVAVALAARGAWLTPLENKKNDHAAFERNVHQFVLTDDFATFEKQTIPFPNPSWLARVLRKPIVRAILPASVRAPLPIDGLGNNPPLAAPPLAHRPTRALLQPGEWRSPPLPLSPRAGWWKIETAGHLGTAGAALELVAVSDGRVLHAIAPARRAGDTWRAAYVPAPREPAILVARLDDPSRWFAFSEPVAMASVSYWTWRLCKHGWLVAGAALIGGIVLAWRRHRGTTPDKTLSAN
jgi:hypothetical protein